MLYIYLPMRYRAIVLLLAAASVIAQTGKSTSSANDNVFGHHQIEPGDLAPAFASPSVNNNPNIVRVPASPQFHTLPGFKVELWAQEDLGRPRMMIQAPNGDVLLSDSSENGRVLILRDTKHTGKPDQRFVFATGLKQPFGLAIHDGYLYVGNTDAVVRFRYQPGDTKAAGPPEKLADLPGKGYHEHWTRNVLFSPDGKKMYVTVGSESNVSTGENPIRAAISEYNPDGSGHRLFATGTRNPIGIAFYPGTNTLWSIVQERDGLGDDLPSDYLTHIQDGGFYGWPYAFIGPHAEPRNPGHNDMVKKTITPDLLFQAHSAAMDVVFYRGKMFPKDFQGDALVTLRGSWNRSQRTGYKIVRVRFRNGKPVGGYDDFVTGWMPDPGKKEVWGRPVGLLELQDGSLLMSEDGNNTIWRTTYQSR
jgi:glucose/arabinose dehydrogenase